MSEENNVNIYDKAMASQTACNAQALVHSLSSEILPEIHEQCGGRTDDINTHPVLVMFVTQLVHLCSGMHIFGATYSKAYTLCKERAEKEWH